MRWCALALIVGVVVALPVPADALKILPHVWFKRGSDALEPDNLPTLASVAETLAGFPELKRVAVIGHASVDDAATPLDRWNLSLARARGVVGHLVSLGVARERLVMQAFGSDRPLDPGTSALARDKNRRIEFVILERDNR